MEVALPGCPRPRCEHELAVQAATFCVLARSWRTEQRAEFSTGDMLIENQEVATLGAYIAKVCAVNLLESASAPWSSGLCLDGYRFEARHPASPTYGRLTFDPAIGLKAGDWIGTRCLVLPGPTGALPDRLWDMDGPAILALAISALAGSPGNRWSSAAVAQQKYREGMAGVTQAAARAAREWNAHPFISA
jgi:hypothetical protein